MRKSRYCTIVFVMDRDELIRQLSEDKQVLKDKRLLEAFKAIDRADFVPEDYKPEGYEDYALPIGFEQTISQPTTVAFMLELLDVKEGDYVLDIGAGSGFTTGLLSHLVGESGSVVGVEIVPELVKQAKKNLEPYNLSNVEIFEAVEDKGYPRLAPYDKILVSAAAVDEIPEELLLQLKPAGILVIPVGEVLVQIKKSSEDDFETAEFPGFNFVQLQ